MVILNLITFENNRNLYLGQYSLFFMFFTINKKNYKENNFLNALNKQNLQPETITDVNYQIKISRIE